MPLARYYEAMNAVAVGRRIEAVSAAEVIALDAAGALPPQPPMEIPRRAPTRAEWEALSWLLALDGPRVIGVAAYRDVYDYHVAADVREIIVVNGRARGCIELLRHMSDGAFALDRRLVGNVSIRNRPMQKLLGRVSRSMPSRLVFEGYAR